MTNKEFFTTRKGLYVSSSFLDLINTDVNQELNKFDYFQLEKRKDDSEIEQKPVNINTVRYLLEKQSHGQDGDLLNNGYFNIFYVGNFVVGVSWYAGNRKWYVSSWERDVHGVWSAGYRVFCNTEVLSPESSELEHLNLEKAIELVKKAGYKVIK